MVARHDFRYSHQKPGFLDRHRPLETVLAAGVILGVALVIAWPHIEGLFHHDDVTATITGCSQSPSDMVLSSLFMVNVDLTNVTGSTRTVTPEDDQGQTLTEVGVGGNTLITLKPHETYSSEYSLYGPVTSVCSDVRIKAVPATPQPQIP